MKFNILYKIMLLPVFLQNLFLYSCNDVEFESVTILRKEKSAPHVLWAAKLAQYFCTAFCS